MSFHIDSAELEPGSQTAMKNSNRYDVEMTDELVGLPFLLIPIPKPLNCPQMLLIV